MAEPAILARGVRNQHIFAAVGVLFTAFAVLVLIAQVALDVFRTRAARQA